MRTCGYGLAVSEVAKSESLLCDHMCAPMLLFFAHRQQHLAVCTDASNIPRIWETCIIRCALQEHSVDVLPVIDKTNTLTSLVLSVLYSPCEQVRSHSFESPHQALYETTLVC